MRREQLEQLLGGVGRVMGTLVSKLAAGRLKDYELVAALITQKLVDVTRVRERIGEIEELRMKAILRWLGSVDQSAHGLGGGGGACATVVGFATSFALKPNPAEMPEHTTFGAFEPSLRMSDAWW